MKETKLSAEQKARVEELLGVRPIKVEENLLGQKILIYSTTHLFSFGSSRGVIGVIALDKRQWRYIERGEILQDGESADALIPVLWVEEQKKFVERE